VGKTVPKKTSDPKDESVTIECLVCGSSGGYLEPKSRESNLCVSCNSTMRDRALIFMLARGLQIEPGPLVRWGADYSRIGVGFDDSQTIASRLPAALSYVNCHLNKFPTLDLTQPPANSLGFFEFAICSEVLEHVTGDPKAAIDGLYTILRPGGFAVVTVPTAQNHVEWYPHLLEVVKQTQDFVEWKDRDGCSNMNFSPEYHGGTGDVLSFRVFSDFSIKKLLTESGFRAIEDLPESTFFPEGSRIISGVYIARK
jgi:SAM-dependent methyltransferase